MDQRDDQNHTGRTQGLGLLSEASDHPGAVLPPPCLPLCCRRSSPSFLTFPSHNTASSSPASYLSFFKEYRISLRFYLREVRMDAACARFVALHLSRRLSSFLAPTSRFATTPLSRACLPQYLTSFLISCRPRAASQGAHMSAGALCLLGGVPERCDGRYGEDSHILRKRRDSKVTLVSRIRERSYLRQNARLL